MARFSWKAIIALVLVVSSASLAGLHVCIFHNAKDLLFYLSLDIVFVPVQVLLVTLIIERLLTERERSVMMKKLNMVIGAFFSEVGSRLMREMGQTCLDFSELEHRLAISQSWRKADYQEASRFIQSYECRFDSQEINLTDLRNVLVDKRSFILGLLQNPNLLEHEGFTDLLWAVCHLSEELEARDDFESLPQADIDHLEGDIQRAFGLLIRQWLSYMEHLKENYPYMYSLSMRTNPFNQAASAVIS